MKIGIVGSRTFDDYNLVKATLDAFKSLELIVSGGAKGADKLGEKYAKENDIETLIHYPDYDEHGKFAPLIRNTDIVHDSDLVIAFWNKKSKGTKDSIRKAHDSNTPIMIIYFKDKII